MLHVQNLSVRYDGRKVLDDLSFTLEAGQWLMLAGPNGAGKSTLISAIGQSAPYEGRVELNGRDVRRFKPGQLAREIGVLTQKHHAGYAFTVDELVRLGRYAYRSPLGEGDDAVWVERALEQTGMTALRGQSILTLSGGELQRAFLAQVFAQNPRVLLLDEPANHLDLAYQKRIFSLIQEWLAQPGRAVLSAVHDVSLARRYGTHALLMRQGGCVSRGKLADVLTAENLQQVYDMDVYGWMRDALSQWK